MKPLLDIKVTDDDTEIWSGRPTTVRSGETVGVLWLERDQMKRLPTVFVGGLLIAEGDGRPFQILCKWGIGSVYFESVWSSPDGLGIICMVPACDAFIARCFGAFAGGPMRMRVALSRDIRLASFVLGPFDSGGAMIGIGAEGFGSAAEDGGGGDGPGTGRGIEPFGGASEDGIGRPIGMGIEPFGGASEAGIGS